MANSTHSPAVSPLQAINSLWWIGAIQGTFAIFFGITALFWPALSLVTLVYLFSSFILALGIVEIVNGVLSINRRSTWWVTLLVGLAALGAGVYLVRHPNVSFATFILVVGLTLIARGLMDGVRIFVDKMNTSSKILMGVVSIAAIVAGIIILLQPVSGGLAFVWVLGLYAMIYGTIMLAVSFELHEELKALLSDIESPAVRVRSRPT